MYDNTDNVYRSDKKKIRPDEDNSETILFYFKSFNLFIPEQTKNNS